MAELIELEGVLLVDKPSGMTSHDVVDRVRRTLRMKRIGHAGTLDPLATGLLIILVGKATRLSQYLMSLDKEYEGTIKFGETTNTQDAEGEVLVTRPVPALTETEIRAALATFIGDQYQTPPMFSAKKQDGVPLYKLARKGKEVEREPRFIRVSAFELTRFALPVIDVRLRCSKGTYVRTIAHDLGEKLDCGAHLAALRRTATDRFHVSQAVPLDKLQAMDLAAVRQHLLTSYEAAPGNVLL